MEFQVIKFAESAKASNVGRSGYSCAHGIQIINCGVELALEGINSRGRVGANRIVIPKAEIDALIAAIVAMRSADSNEGDHAR
jgi:hypothetical protein